MLAADVANDAASRLRSRRLMMPKTPRFRPEMKTRRGLAVSWPR
jgi:hypothetical protein